MNGVGHRVAITGLGVIAPCGSGKENYWKGLFGPGINGTTSLTISDWDPLPFFDSPKDARRADRVEQFALAAAAEAFEQAGDIGVDPSRFGTIFSKCFWICSANSRVGVRINALHVFAYPACSFSNSN